MAQPETTSEFIAHDTDAALVGCGRVKPRNEIADDMPRYQRYLFDRIRPFLKGRICEVGSGTGQLTQFMADHEHVTAVEPYGPSHMLALQRFCYQLNIRCVQCFLEDCPSDEVPGGTYDTVLGINLLEHLEYDITALEIMGDLTAAGGHVLVIVPAGRSPYGTLDRARGHVRRYSRKHLRHAFEQAYLEVTRCLSFNFPGLLAWWWLSRVLRRKRVSPWTARLLDACVPLVARGEHILRPPIGQSLLMVGKRRQ